MNFKKVFISELSPAKYNPRKDLQSSDPEYQRIKKSIEEFGYVDPIIVNSDYTVIGGHQRLKVLKELGHAQIDVVVVDIPKNKEKALNVALNKITGEWDDARLVSLLHEIKADGMLEFTGFDDAEFQSLLNDLNNPEIPGASVEQAKQKLTEKFIVPPFSVLDTRQGYWQQRKAYWIALGIKSELGRGGTETHPQGQHQTRSPRADKSERGGAKLIHNYGCGNFGKEYNGS